jgi:prophage regulatory protein
MVQQIYKLPEVKTVTGLSGSAIYRGAKNGNFPKPIKLGQRSSGWLKSEVEQWLSDRIEASRANVEASL